MTISSTLSTNPRGGQHRQPPAITVSLANVALLAVVAGFAALLPGVPGVRLILLAVFVLLGPGAAVIVWLPKMSSPGRAVIIPTTGLALLILCLVAEVFLTYWHPQLTLCAFGVLSAVSLLLNVRLTRAERTGFGGDPDQREADLTTRSKPDLQSEAFDPPVGWRAELRRTRLVWIVLAAALVSWVVCLPTVGTAAPSVWGLLGAASPALLISIALAGLGGAVAAAKRSRFGLLASAAMLIIAERLTESIATAVPLYPWTYKHIAVVDYIDRFHFVSHGLDVYQDWPGLFATTAWVHELTGVAPITIAHWFTPVYHVALVAAIYGAARAWGVSPVTAAAAGLVFEACDFIAQDYFSPQALAYLLSIAVLAGLAECFRSRLSVVPVFLLFAAVTVTHQLSPYWLIIVTVLLVMFCKLRPWWVPVGFIAMAGAFLLYNYSAVKQYGVVSSPNPLQNVRLTKTAEPVFGIRTQFYAIVAVYLILFVSAGLFLLVRIIRRQKWGVGMVIGISPLLLLAAQQYGGEAIFRVALYCLPGLCVINGHLLVEGASRGRKLLGVTGVFAVITAVLSAHAFMGSFSAYKVSTSELAVWNSFNRQAPIPAFFDAIAAGYPSNPQWYYALRSTNNANYGSSFFGSSSFVDESFNTPRQYRQFMSLVKADTEGVEAPVYLVLSSAGQNYGQFYGVLRPGVNANLYKFMAKDPRWKLVTNAGSSQLFELNTDLLDRK